MRGSKSGPRTEDPPHGTLQMAYREYSRTASMCAACSSVYRRHQRNKTRAKRAELPYLSEEILEHNRKYLIAVFTAVRTQAPGDWKKVREMETWRRAARWSNNAR